MKKFYTMKEVNRHNKRNDAWIVYKGEVYDITKWISKHPGGNIIMKGLGKNIDQLFKKFHTHSNYAKNIMKQYKIGKLRKSIKKTKKINKKKFKRTKRYRNQKGGGELKDFHDKIKKFPMLKINSNDKNKNNLKNLIRVTDIEYNKKEHRIYIKYIDGYGEKGQVNIYINNIKQYKFINDNDWYGKDFLSGELYNILKKRELNEIIYNDPNPYTCCNNDKNDVKVISAHGCILGSFILPKDVKIITLTYLSCSISDTKDRIISKKISNLYNKGYTIFENDDENKKKLTKEGQKLFDELNKDSRIFQLYGFKLNLEYENVNDQYLTFGRNCHNYRFCKITCINKPNVIINEENIYNDNCIKHVDKLKNNDKKILLSDFIKINGKGTYIINTCRKLCKENTEQELNRTISDKENRHININHNPELSEFLKDASTDDINLYIKLVVNLPKNDKELYNNIVKIYDYIKNGNNNKLKNVFSQTLPSIFKLYNVY